MTLSESNHVLHDESQILTYNIRLWVTYPSPAISSPEKRVVPNQKKFEVVVARPPTTFKARPFPDPPTSVKHQT